MERHGVLVVGPNPAFLNHIGRVLPSLGESDVVFMTTGDFVPGLHVTAEDTADAARLKGSLKMLDVLAAAVADRQRLPEDPLPIELADVTVRIDAETAEWAREEARASGLPHNEARAVFSDDRHVGAHRTGDRPDRPGLADPSGPRRLGAPAGRTCSTSSHDHDAFTAALDELWPILTPETLLAQLYTSPERLRAAGADQALWRADGEAWTVSDVPLLDELVDLLGRDKHRRPGRRAGTEGRGSVRRGRAGHHGQPRGPDGRRGPPAGPGHARRRGPGRTLSSSATPVNSPNVPPRTGTGPTGTSWSTRPRNCPKWTGGC